MCFCCNWDQQMGQFLGWTWVFDSLCEKERQFPAPPHPPTPFIGLSTSKAEAKKQHSVLQSSYCREKCHQAKITV
eukprot:1161954-Pelagomonas_calceolata.AAC.5